MVWFLIGKGVDLNLKDKRGATIMHYAVQKDDASMVSFLIKEGVVFSVPDEDEILSFHVAAELGHETVIRLLADKLGTLIIQIIWGCPHYFTQ